MDAFKIFAIALSLVTQVSLVAQTYSEYEVKTIQGHYRHQYFRYFLDEILTLARNDFGDFKISPIDCGSEKECLANDGYKYGDVLYSPSENWDLSDFKKIEAPILSGLLGLRLAVFDYKDREKMEAIKGPVDYKKLRVSFNKNWKDYKILKQNKFKLIEVDSFDGIYDALAQGQADYTLRGISEAYIEILNQKQNLLVDNKNFIYYHYPVYLYVRKNNKRLYRAVVLGMNKLKAQSYNTFTKSFIGQNLVLEENSPCRVYNINTEIIQIINQCNLKSLIEIVAGFKH